MTISICWCRQSTEHRAGKIAARAALVAAAWPPTSSLRLFELATTEKRAVWGTAPVRAQSGAWRGRARISDAYRGSPSSRSDDPGWHSSRGKALADFTVTKVERSPRDRVRVRQPTLMWAAVHPKIDLHRKPGILHRSMRLAGTSKLDLAADRAQRSAAAKLERAVSFHGAVDRPGERGQA